MILITGATGFIGRTLIRHLSDIGHPLRALIRPSQHTPRLPKGFPIEVAVVSLADVRGLRAALRDVDTIFHLASAEGQGSRGNLLTADIQGTENLVEAAADAGVEQIVETIMQVTNRPRLLVSLSPITLRALTVLFEGIVPNFPISSFWLDYFAVNRTCAVDSMPRVFGLMPARFTYRLDYLNRKTLLQRVWAGITNSASNLADAIRSSLTR